MKESRFSESKIVAMLEEAGNPDGTSKSGIDGLRRARCQITCGIACDSQIAVEAMFRLFIPGRI